MYMCMLDILVEIFVLVNYSDYTWMLKVILFCCLILYFKINQSVYLDGIKEDIITTVYDAVYFSDNG